MSRARRKGIFVRRRSPWSNPPVRSGNVYAPVWAHLAFCAFSRLRGSSYKYAHNFILSFYELSLGLPFGVAARTTAVTGTLYGNEWGHPPRDHGRDGALQTSELEGLYLPFTRRSSPVYQHMWVTVHGTCTFSTSMSLASNQVAERLLERDVQWGHEKWY
ncbi:hypothetical protein L227DRAFT_178296 [Lentinus tigrinus ALCF2SS1-6]|uniref:Uncharacterized protein n=1 Tax=Lentinus tigrinus ALCF2SS1-6 TaxID=1328759 RepID=A0A5C2S589_9APHY|nr:hypothetical protein L227DRAFT_178296 [Lentinus tigrinus ALCF2SS1-6]